MHHWSSQQLSCMSNSIFWMQMRKLVLSRSQQRGPNNGEVLLYLHCLHTTQHTRYWYTGQVWQQRSRKSQKDTVSYSRLHRQWSIHVKRSPVCFQWALLSPIICNTGELHIHKLVLNKRKCMRSSTSTPFYLACVDLGSLSPNAGSSEKVGRKHHANLKITSLPKCILP